jgi:hypothetical protein
MTGAGFAGRGGLVSSGPFLRPAVRQVGPGAPQPREGQRDHPCAGAAMPAAATTAVLAGGRPTLGPANNGALRARIFIRCPVCRRKINNYQWP